MSYIGSNTSGSDLPIIQKLSDAYRVWYACQQQVSRVSRYTLGVKIDHLYTDALEHMLLAGYAPRLQKRGYLAQAATKLDALKFFLQLAWSTGMLTSKQYATLAPPLVEVGKMLGGWVRSIE